ncbi:uncharacterized protein KQ657_000441 [Scheffersomyces spartinae]|uniref:Uncharacterized protein n=1 Tax=Scheffersomyces spartinae TaxID=45513 RepID=A0A9P7V990_9ASCO|nr:uncharacterized protein KQ657_000441 [Scheffersomyces spartinae]KAG7193750.1 hypothetical protein KQ657_000441 [Scheffersomyces spartinae]
MESDNNNTKRRRLQPEDSDTKKEEQLEETSTTTTESNRPVSNSDNMVINNENLPLAIEDHNSDTTPATSTPLTIVSISSRLVPGTLSETSPSNENETETPLTLNENENDTPTTENDTTSTEYETSISNSSSHTPSDARPPTLPSLANIFRMPAVDGRTNSRVFGDRNPILPPISPRSVIPNGNEPSNTTSVPRTRSNNMEQIDLDEEEDDDEVQILGVVEIVPEGNSTIRHNNNNNNDNNSDNNRIQEENTTADDDGVVVTGERQLRGFEVIHTPFGSYGTGNQLPSTNTGRRTPTTVTPNGSNYIRRTPLMPPNNTRFRLPASRRDVFHRNPNIRSRNNQLRMVSTMLPFDLNNPDNVSRTLHNFYNHVTIPLGDTGYGAVVRGYPLGGGEAGGLSQWQGNGPDDIEASIMSRIERELDEAVSDKISRENLYNRKAYLQKKKLIVDPNNKRHVSRINSEVQVYCELCGVELGCGIPQDFKPNPKYDEDFEKYQQQYDVPAPWFCNKMITDVDKDLSKRVFSAKCGHVYCGRCVKNIGNRSGRISKSTKLKLSIDNPLISSPKVCHCNKRFAARSFTELYI